MPSLLYNDVEDSLLIYCRVVFLYFLHGPTVIGYAILVSLPSVITTHFTIFFFNFWYLKSMKSTCCL